MQRRKANGKICVKPDGNSTVRTLRVHAFVLIYCANAQ
jgi:hypothetical protein